ncbi:uncharacterized protein STEHIDRAFT_143586 [Stereum hirsutum FP-91666 SS1]|uniref:uncharacterized protein n=1 Tax=Stereum hirsutum (strain FP-91666) TaxID=721885 RepID=UPI000440A405|nr:uncharacterized protein STEHIDRAFT_143586 [Stereum hirsutum FP-91666 SS1]EIM92148.1 hypothetical protein STEHIDRAFT_143586 [Stereum hirsutum FP-91666 SS1]
MTTTRDFRALLGSSPSSTILSTFITELASLSSTSAVVPDVKSYRDAVYFNYYTLGLSLLFAPINGYKPKSGLKRGDLRDADLALDGLDIFNVPSTGTDKAAKSSTTSEYSTYPVSPITISISPKTQDKECATSVTFLPSTNGKDIVEALGEPERKGGGSGPASGGMGIWMDWPKQGIMVELGGEESRGPKAWETGKDAVWKVLSVSVPK